MSIITTFQMKKTLVYKSFPLLNKSFDFKTKIVMKDFKNEKKTSVLDEHVRFQN